ncbi:MAG: hypothetical protein ABH827_05820 [bacterium]
MKKLYDFYNFCALFLVVLLFGCVSTKFIVSMPSAAQPQLVQQSAPPVLPQFAHLAQIAQAQQMAQNQAPTHHPTAHPDKEEYETVIVEEEQTPGAENVQLRDDTIGNQGNWIKKNEWLSKTYELRNEIQNERSKIQNVRQKFNEKYTVIDKELDAFYTKMGLEQGKLEELFNSVVKFLNKKKQKLIEQATQEQKDGITKDRDYSIKIDTIEEQIKTLRTKLDQLQLDMKSIVDLDNSLIQRLEKADEQIKQAEKESTKIREVTEQQWKVIDHNIARENYYKFRGNTLEKLKSIANYLENDLLRDFENVTQVIRTQFAKVQATTDELEKDGIIIKDRSSRINKLKLEVIRNTETEKQQLLEAQQKSREVKKVEILTWYGKVYDIFTSVIARLITPIKSLYSMLFGSQELKVRTRTHTEASLNQAPNLQKPTSPTALQSSAPTNPLFSQPAPTVPANQQSSELLETILAPSSTSTMPSANNAHDEPLMPSAIQ